VEAENMALMKSMMLFVMSMAVVPSVEAVEVSPSNRAPVIAAGLWEVSAINQSIALQVSPEDVKPFFFSKRRRSLVCREEKMLDVSRSTSDQVVRGVVGSDASGAVALIIFDRNPADSTGRIQTLMEIYRGDLASEFTITTIVDDTRSYRPTPSAVLAPMFRRTVERLSRRGDCPSDMKPGDYRELPTP
jgi:hypothetical protein